VLRHSECFGGRWACTKDVCSKTCSVLGYQHFQTFDGKTYEFHGPESSFVLVEVSPLPAAAAFVANESVPTQLARCRLARCWFPGPAVSSAKTWIYFSKRIHTHPFNGPFSGLPGWAGSRKVKPIWILQKQETVSGSGISRTICKSAPRSRQITTPAPHHSFLQAVCPYTIRYEVLF